jgi:hypothetical protein
LLRLITTRSSITILNWLWRERGGRGGEEKKEGGEGREDGGG